VSIYFKYYKSLFYLFVVSSSLSQPIFGSEIKAFEASTSYEYQLQEKVDRLASKIDANQDQKEELEKICRLIQDKWDEWMNNPNGSENAAYFRINITDQTSVTVHPSAREVCIFLEGHTTTLGKGYFKRVEKGLSYDLEKEVAVAIPYRLSFDFYSSSYSSYDSTYDYEYDTTSFEDDFSSFDSYYSYISSVYDDSENYSSVYGWDWSNFSSEDEAKMLEKVQGCRSVIEVYFISYHESNDSDSKVPLIVGKYYNGGTFYNYLNKEKNASLDTRLLICHDLLLGLSDIHNRNIVHNDLHGENILLQRDFLTKEITGAYLADFGLARHSEDSDNKALKISKKYDVFYMLDMLMMLFTKEYGYGQSGEEMLVSDFLNDAQESKMEAREVYDQFIELLTGIVDEETLQGIMKNANLPKSIKVKSGNVVRWVRQK